MLPLATKNPDTSAITPAINTNRTIYFPASLFNSLRKRLFNGFDFFFTIPDPPLPYASHCGNSHEYGHHEALRRDLPSSRLRYYVLP